MRTITRVFTLSAVMALPMAVLAQDSAADSDDALFGGELDAVTILGNSGEVDEVPGSAHYVGDEELSSFSQPDILRVLRQVPGVYVQEEEGYGLRPNIGIRGSGLDRSSRIALLEDGVLIAPAPFAAPAAYYVPTQLRIYGVEVLKGPASVRLGARTTGGAINFLSTPIPQQTSGALDVLYGTDSTAELHGWYGVRGTNGGALIETAQLRSNGFKHINGGGDAGFRLSDYLVKLRANTTPGGAYDHSIELKLGQTSQTSNETYLGLTDDDFRRDPYQRYTASQNDILTTFHNQIQLTYRLEAETWSLQTTAYNNRFSRNWERLRSVNGKRFNTILSDPSANATELAILRGELDTAADALTFRANNRSYYARGVAVEFDTEFSLGATEHYFEVGLRLHEDEEDRFQHQDGYSIVGGRLMLTSSGAPGSTTNRVSDARVLSLFVQDEIRLGRWLVTPGVRAERIELTRRDFSTADPSRANGPTRVRENDLDVIIPGLAASFRVNNHWLLLAGVSKGYNPPSPGSNADEEESINGEFGVRFAGTALSFEAILFLNKYDNLVGSCTDSTGGTCTIGDQFDGGEATAAGLEFQATWVLRSWLRLGATYTFTQAEFDNSFNSNFDPWGDVQSGDELPYIPQHQAQLSAHLTRGRWTSNMTVSYVDSVRTVAGQGSVPANERTDSAVIVDWALGYQLNPSIQLFARIDNVLDREYLASRRPAGARPGKPRAVLVGFKSQF